MGNSLRASLISLFISAVVFDYCLVDAALSDSVYFYWGAQRGKITGWDDCELMLFKQGDACDAVMWSLLGDGSGIASKASFLYGSFSMEIKLVPGNSAGTVTTFYLSSFGERHDEIDFEFLGNVEGQGYVIHTNIFAQGVGKREQQFRVWFDPTTHFHNYTIFWNPYAVVWLVDGLPIRVFRNHHDPQINFPDSQAMKALASIWNADQWATQGGRFKTDWRLAPLKARFQNLKTSACFWSGPDSVRRCASRNPNNWWAEPTYFRVSESQMGQMNWARKNFMIYDYCRDFKRFNWKMPKECTLPQ